MPTTKNRLIKHIGGGVEGEIKLIHHPTWGISILKTRTGGTKISNKANVTLTLLQGQQQQRRQGRENIPSRHTICQVFAIEDPAFDMIIEWCDGGDLRFVINKLHSQSYSLGKAFLRHVQLHIGSALVYLHCGILFDVETGECRWPARSSRGKGKIWNRISHRDVKPDNIFLRWNGKVDSTSSPFPDLVLGDFGNAITERAFESIFYDDGRNIEPPKRNTFCGQNYGPPEFFLLNGGDDLERVSISSSFDIWQFGATLYELITRIVLNMAVQNQDRDVDKIRKWIRVEEWGETGGEVMDMIRENPRERMTDEILVRMLPF